MLAHLKLAPRLGLGFGLMLLLLALMGWYALDSLGEMSRLNRDLYEHPFTVRSTVLSIDGDVMRMNRSLRDLILSTSAAELEAIVASLDHDEARILAAFKIVEERFLGEPAMYLKAEELFSQWGTVRHRVIELVRTGQRSEAQNLVRDQSNPQVLALAGALNDLAAFAVHKAVYFHEQSQEANRRAWRMLLIFMGLTLTVGLLCAWWISRSIVNPARAIAQDAQAIAAGQVDRALAYRGQDEIGQMAASLRDMLDGVIGEAQSIKDSIRGPLWTTDEQLTITHLNPAAEAIAKALSGHPASELMGQATLEQALLDRDRVLLALARHTLTEGTTSEADLIYQMNDGREMVLHQSISRLEDRRGRVMGLVGVGLDVTQRRREQREKELLQEQLRQSQKMEAVGTLAGGVAHDFNNILMAIIGFTELTMEDMPPDEGLRDNLRQVLESSYRARDLVAQLLAFSRKQVLDLRNVRVNEVVEQNQTMLRRIIGEDVELQFFLHPEAGTVLADFHQMEQVLLNLVANCRDAMPTGGKVSVETGNVELDENYAATHAEALPGPHVMLAVSDNGPGMDAYTKAHAFDPFFTTKEKGKGTGLGLAMVYGIVKQLGGNIYLYSELGQGTTVKIYLPRTWGVSEGPDHGADEAPLPGGTEHVVVVEDEPVVRQFICQALTRLGYQVFGSESALETLAYLSDPHKRVDLLLTDVIMPRMNGRQLYEDLSHRRPQLKVLYISGYTDNVIAHHGVLDRDMAFLQKPVSIAALSRKVRLVLDGPPPPATAPLA